MREAADEGAVITKSRLSDGGFVARSEILRLGHGNDMTYDSKNHRLVCAHGHSEGKILTIVDPIRLNLLKILTSRPVRELLHIMQSATFMQSAREASPCIF